MGQGAAGADTAEGSVEDCHLLFMCVPPCCPLLPPCCRPHAAAPMLLHQSRCVQVHTLLKGLEKIAASADIPMLVAGDFNTVPGSAAHTLLVKGSVPPSNPVRPGAGFAALRTLLTYATGDVVCYRE